MEGKIRVKVGFSPKPAGWVKPITPMDTDPETTLKSFLDGNNDKEKPIPYRNYPACQLNNNPISEKDFENTILQEGDTIMFSQDISGN